MTDIIFTNENIMNLPLLDYYDRDNVEYCESPNFSRRLKKKSIMTNY